MERRIAVISEERFKDSSDRHVFVQKRVITLRSHRRIHIPEMLRYDRNKMGFLELMYSSGHKTLRKKYGY
ncbi:MAG: hypothetical protein DRP87_16305 [Spirochaetes bacterium]|nr:MAG: hypothetical protein DRP87_16305 [Spirochaetota bacterium]